ncbi:hypothetical protein SISSUDRAFT_1065439 [Sistotremastrum suecicum HHB10207 ss-3]|uniref:Uncharacterized protein n=1 Tax=Sistotremastrum suecicum HHB10207 ss-3 TaxID=1314776 RepID=A0A165ZG39_9AGAM|nr:hypothetical protein SISSUDRAFT_1065439 [Sistotremastrum suecicum HHB10207 ss-3]
MSIVSLILSSPKYPMSEPKGTLEIQPLFPLREIEATFSFGPLVFTYKGPITSNTTPIRSIRSNEAWLIFDTLEDLKDPSTFQGSMGRDQFTTLVNFLNGVTIRVVLLSAYFPPADFSGNGEWNHTFGDEMKNDALVFNPAGTES